MPISHDLSKNKPNNLGKNEWASQITRLDGAYADSTIRAYRTDALTFVRWCEERKFSPFPASPEHIGDFVTHEAQRCSVSTIKRRIAAIGKIHRLMKLDNPTNDEDVKLALRRVLRSKFSRPNQASGLTACIRDQLISCCETSLAGKRDRALITVGYDTLSRRSELISICIEDVTFNDNGARLLIKRAKNDPYGKGRISHLRPKTAQYLKDWIEIANITQGPLFRAIKHEKI
jgi:site-specific recombinase XerD